MGGTEEKSLKQRTVGEKRLCVTHSGHVYDITQFADRHPGGREWLLKYAGQDVTQVMQEQLPHKHTIAAYSILQKYRISEAEETGKQNGMAKDDGKVQFYSMRNDPLIDWSKPVFSQIAGLGDNYYKWVHEPVDTSLRLFHSDILEFLSRCPWYMVPIFWIPVTLILMLCSHTTLAAEPVMWNLCGARVMVTPKWLFPLVCLGILLWTLCEYTIHRWLFHMKPPTCIPLLMQLHFVLHGQHHKSPMDRTRLVFPTLPASILASLIFGIYSLFSPWAVAQALFAGTVIGYMGYDLTHYYIHHGSPALSYFINLKRYHVKHHFETQNLGFGISSKFWDYPFGTLIPETN